MQVHRDENFARMMGIDRTTEPERSRFTGEMIDQEVICPRCHSSTNHDFLVQHLEECFGLSEAQKEGKTLEEVLEEEMRRCHRTEGRTEDLTQENRKGKEKQIESTRE